MMLRNLFTTSLPLYNLMLRAFLVYFAILVLLRFSGKRQLGQMGPTELVVILLISNAVQNSMNGGDNSLIGGIVMAAVLVFLSTLISNLTYRSRALRIIFEGTPTLLIHKGRVLYKNLVRERLSEGELRVLLRKQGVHDISGIENAVLEADGTLSIVHNSDSAFEREI